MRLKFILRKYRLKLGKCFLDKKNTQPTPVFPPKSILFWVFGFYGGKGLINHPSPNS